MRRDPIGAEPDEAGTHFRVWAPDHERLALRLEDADRALPMQREPDGYFSAHVVGVRAGDRYRFAFDDGSTAPDPASRWQPDGPHGASAVVDPTTFAWSDGDWTGVRAGRQVFYELHIGTFTDAGTWAAAEEQLPELAALGVTMLEIMPVAEFPGRFNWGYDGVSLFAPAHVYGAPDDVRRFVDRAHALDIAVILDVVYNHTGPDGSYLHRFARSYFSDRHTTDWGAAINFDGTHSEHVREFFLANAEYWIREFHMDGLRIDATQNIYDDGSPHILRELTARARAAAGSRRIWIVAENEPQDATLLRPAEQGGYGMDAAWNDDFHHSAIVALTGRAEAYYTDYRGAPQEFVSTARSGFLFQGQHYVWQGKPRGSPAADLPAACFVNFLQNHDQIANSVLGQRVHELASAGEHRAMTALLLLLPGTALLFQGQEFRASAPFLFFADHEPALATRVHQGRREFLAQFPSLASREQQDRIPDPAEPSSFLQSKLDLRERHAHRETLRMHRDLIRLSRTDPAFAAQDARRVHGAVLGERAFVLRYHVDDGDDRLLLVNLGTEFELLPAPEPLLAPPAQRRWTVIWSSDDPDYGGGGIVEPECDGPWHVPGRTALVLAPGRHVPEPNHANASS